jgi:hypothetical protein
VVWVLAALCLAVRGSLGWSGLMLGLAAATKQQGLLFVPLVMVIGARCLTAEKPGFSTPQRLPGHQLCLQLRGFGVQRILKTWFLVGLFFALGFLAVMAPVAWWDSLRWRLQPNYFEQSLISYGGLTWVDPAQLVERLEDWAEILHYITASLFLHLLFLVGLPCLLFYDLTRRSRETAAFFDITVLVFVVLFLLGHWVLSFNVWDRYLLGLVPILLILLARIIWLVSVALENIRPSLGGKGRERVGSHKLRFFGIVVLLATTLAGPAWVAAQSGYPIGGDHGAYDGIEDVADYFRERVPAGSILYHHWLGWHYSFYMFDFPLVFRWYPSPDELAQDARQADGAQRYIVFPRGKSTAGARGALADAGLGLHGVYSAYGRDGSISFTVYRIEDQK